MTTMSMPDWLHVRLQEALPLRAVHAWHAGTLLPLAMETSARRGGTPALHAAVIALHREALAGTPPPAARWSEALRPALHELYRHAYPHTEAHARAYRSAIAYAAANAAAIDAAYGSGEAYARHYADLSTDANAQAFAAANAQANAALLAQAFAARDAGLHAETCPSALVNALAFGAGEGLEGEATATARGAAYARLAEGLRASLDHDTNDA